MSADAVVRRDSIDGVAVGCMLLLTFSWGFNYVAAKYSNLGYSPVLVSLLRSAIATIAVFAWCRFRSIPIFSRDGSLWPGLLAGALFGAEFALVFWSLDLTTVARSSLLLNSMPFWVLIGAHFLLGERMSSRKWLGLALAFCGVILVFSDRLSLPSPSASLGDAIALVASVLWGLTVIVIKRSRLNDISPEKVLLYQLAVSAVATVFLLPAAGPLVRDPTAITWASILFQAIYIVAFTYTIWFWVMRRYPASGLSSFAFLTPAFGVLCGSVFLGEPLTWRLFVALLLIAAGLVIVNRPSRAAPV